MKSIPVAAFGYRAFLCTGEPGNTSQRKVDTRGVYQESVFFFTKGITRSTVLETGEQNPDRTAGWFNLEDQAKAIETSTETTVISTTIEASEWLCIPKAQNPQGLPTLSRLVLEPTSLHNFVDGSNVYLIRGTLSIKGKTFVGPCEIRVRSGNVLAESMDKSYSLLFS